MAGSSAEGETPAIVWTRGRRCSPSSRRGTVEVGGAHSDVAWVGVGQTVAGDGEARGRRRWQRKLVLAGGVAVSLGS
jgi:hypothetical protein